MPDLIVVDGAKIRLEPGPGWQWVGWDGQITLNVPQGIADVAGHAVASESDFVALGLLLVGRQYKAMGFEDTPGAVVTTIIQVNASTLARASSLTDQRMATEQTSGTFTVTCVPSIRIASPPVPDPMCGARMGRWRVVNSGQTIYRTD
jgi:hypothetical protein